MSRPTTQEKKTLRMWWKYYKIGFKKWEEIPTKYQTLLLEYYPIQSQ